MALQLTGPINMQDLATEFGGGVPHALSEYYRGGGLVPNASANNNIPTSGPISLGNFYGGTNRLSVTVTISSNQTNYVFNTAKVPGYVAGIMDVTFVINSGVILSASSTGAYAGNVDTSWNSGDTVRIINNGFIIGGGGVGGRGGDQNGNGSSGASGGPAFIAQRPVTITNNNTIAGGGGGGGGGGSGAVADGDGNANLAFYGGGGGGGGRTNAAFNTSGGAGGSAGSASGSPGGTGTFSSQGAGGGSTKNGGNGDAGDGASGGGWGAPGGTGQTGLAGFSPQFLGGGGGSGGASIAGNGNITWLATGTRLGAIG